MDNDKKLNQYVFKSETKCIVEVACFINSTRAKFKVNSQNTKKFQNSYQGIYYCPMANQ